MLGLDYAGGRPGGAAIAAAGYGFVCRYLTDGGSGLPGKLLLPEEAADLIAHGILIVSNFEAGATNMLGGAGQGTADAQQAQAQHAACGGPPDRPIYFSADWDVVASERPAVAAYLTAAAQVLGGVQRVGIYGSCGTVDWALASGLAAWGWQTDAWSWDANANPPAYRVSPGRHIHQRIQQDTVAGIACDVNEAITADFGQWQQEAPDMDATDKRVAADTLTTAQNAAGIASEVRNLILDTERGVLFHIGVVQGQVAGIQAALAQAVPAVAGSTGAPVDMAAITAAAHNGAAAAVAALHLAAVQA
jgi:hypothetical protein